MDRMASQSRGVGEGISRGEGQLRIGAVLGKTRGLVIVFISLTLIMAITSVAPAYQDYVFTYSDSSYSVPDTTFDNGDTVYVTVTDTNTSGGTRTISVKNDQEENIISVIVDDTDADGTYKGGFIIHSGADAAGYLHMKDGQTATITANLDGDEYEGTAKITADYVTALTDNIWTYSDSARTVEETGFGDGDTVYVKVTDTQTTGGTKAITVANNNIGNTISVNVTDSNNDSFYLGSFIVYSGANDDANDKLALFYGESATITADLANDGAPGTKTISANYVAPAPTNLTATAIAGGSIRLDWTASSPETNVAQYNIYRATTSQGQNFASPLASVSVGTTTYTDNATSGGVTYYYVVRAQSNAGHIETNTNEAIATADATLPPSPSNLVAAPVSGDGIELSWTASSPEDDVTQYNIYRATTSGGQDYSSPTYTVSVGTTSYTDTAATPGQAYYYVVRAQDAAGNTDGNTNEVWATAGYSFSVSQVYIMYQGSALYNLASSTSRNNPTVFARGRIDEIYFKVTIHTGVPLNEATSTIALYKLVDSETETVSGSQEIDQDTGTAELSLQLDPAFDPAVDEHERDGLYWVDITVADTGGNSGDFDFYFIYDTTSPSVPNFQITSYDPGAGSITVSGTTVPDNLSDPQEVEIFVNDSSKGTVTANASYQFSMSGIVLDTGSNYVTVKSKDKAGNESELSDPVEFYSNPAALLSLVFRTTHVVQSDSPIEVIYTVTEYATVAIRVYNFHGEIVKEWTGDAYPDVGNSWTWYGKNMYDQEVNNGTYIFRISAKTSGGRHGHKISLLAVAR